MTRLSIVIPSYCRTDLLALCLQSLARYAPPNTEIIVVDDGSSDARVSRTASAFTGVTVIRLSRQRGFAAAANAGINAASGTIVELLNDDTEATAGWADSILPWFDDPRVVAVAPLVLQNTPEEIPPSPRIDSAGDEYDPGGFARKRFHGEPVTSISGDAVQVSSVSAAAAFYRRSAVLDVGGFAEDFRAYFEDVDLSRRLVAAGGTLLFEPQSRVWHRVSASYGRRPGRRLLEQQSCNEERLFWRNLERSRRPSQLVRHLAVVAAKAVRRQNEGTLAPWLAGRCRALVTELTQQFQIPKTRG